MEKKKICASEAKAKNLTAAGNERVLNPKQESPIRKFFAIVTTPKKFRGKGVNS